MSEEGKDGLLSGYLRYARFKKAIPHISGNKILDIGCDEGYIIPYLPKGIEYFGVERDPVVLSRAKEKYPQYDFLQMDVSTDTIRQMEQGSFDTILMTAVIEHLDNPIGILEELHSKLTEQGRIIMTSPIQKSHKLQVLLGRLGLMRGNKHEHKSYVNNKTFSQLYAAKKFKPLLYKTFQFGMNQLWVLEKCK